jgi:Domain of unknown function (DUF4406)
MSGPGAVHNKARVYISGPMSGFDNCNFAAFDAAAERILRQNDTPVNPAAIVRALGYDGGPELYLRDKEFFYKDIMNILSQVLQSCQQIYMLRGWERSKGARAEHALAEHFGVYILYEADDRRFQCPCKNPGCDATGCRGI